VPIDAGTAYHDIVDNRKATLATDPISLAVLETTVRKHCRFVKRDSAAILCLGKMQLLGMEELPY
jgi:hypothetical protein